jgi:hypothetical protein
MRARSIEVVSEHPSQTLLAAGRGRAGARPLSTGENDFRWCRSAKMHSWTRKGRKCIPGPQKDENFLKDEN